ncbi:MAG: hypothetical protein VX215_00590 [Pseudomonadota bacterium]|nr:hypothetical protein [Pseudomonadota bacterium]
MEEEGVIESDAAVASEPVIAPEPVIESEPVISPEPLVKTTTTPYINTDSNKIDYVGALEGFIIVILICMIALGLAKRIGR